MSTNRTSTEATSTRKSARPLAPAKSGGSPFRRRKAQASATPVAQQARYQLIAEAAYFIAERRGFTPGSELEDWFQAEAEVARRLGELADE